MKNAELKLFLRSFPKLTEKEVLLKFALKSKFFYKLKPEIKARNRNSMSIFECFLKKHRLKYIFLNLLWP